jgi:4'-phosphopantetheinyl transferase
MMIGSLFNGDVEWKNYQVDFSLNRNSVHVLKCSVAKFYDQVASIYEEVLSENELIKADRYIHKEDKKRFIVSKYMLRSILSALISTPPSLIQFKLSPQKKLFIKEGIEFNVAHSGNMVLLAIGRHPVGIDVEFINRNFDYETLIPTVCNDLERSFINSGLDKQICFYNLWTRKEAILKATGEGLLDSLPELNCLSATIYRNQTTYYLSSLMVENEYMMSLAHSSPDEIFFWKY